MIHTGSANSEHMVHVENLGVSVRHAGGSLSCETCLGGSPKVVHTFRRQTNVALKKSDEEQFMNNVGSVTPT